MKLLNMKRIFYIGIIASMLWGANHPIICHAKAGFSIASDSNASTPSDATPPQMDEGLETVTKSSIIFYYDPKPLVADVYVRASLFDRVEYDYHEFRNLTPRDSDREELTNVFIHWDRDAYNENINSGKTEFQISGIFGPNTLNEYNYKLWEAGLLQFEASSQPRLNVHVRPSDMITTYESAASEESSRIVKAGTSFENAGLPDTGKLSPVGSLYDRDAWFSIAWNEAQYSAGMASGAKSFVVDGTYQIASFETEDYKKMWEQGLLHPAQAPQITVNLYGKPETPIFYYNAYGDTGIYHTHISPGTMFEQMIKPQEGWLSLKGGQWYDDTLFQIVWNKEEYQKGMAGGADSFQISGTYDSALLGEEEQEWWNEGLIQIEPGSAPGKLMVHVVREKKISFTISFRSGGPLFYFPTPQGATQVIGEVSMDGINWYSEESTDDYIDNFYENSEFWICQYDEDGELIEIPQDVPSYYRMRITGSAYEGVTDILIINDGEGTEPDDNGDIDGNRGGGGQTETHRVNGPSQAKIDKITGPGVLSDESKPIETLNAAPSGEESPSQETSSEGVTIPESDSKPEKLQNQSLAQEETTHPEFQQEDKVETDLTSVPSEQSDTQQSNPEQRIVETTEAANQEVTAAIKRNSSKKKPTSATALVLVASAIFMGSIAALGYFYLKKR